MLYTLLLSFGVDIDVVYEDHDKLIQEGSEDLIHVVHEHGYCIFNSKGHHNILIMPIM